MVELEYVRHQMAKLLMFSGKQQLINGDFLSHHLTIINLWLIRFYFTLL